jgi:hypothetical protein
MGQCWHGRARLDSQQLSNKISAPDRFSAVHILLWAMTSAIGQARNDNKSLVSRGAGCKFTVKYRQQSGRQIRVNKISFTRFTKSVIFPNLHRGFYTPLGHFWGLKNGIFGGE